MDLRELLASPAIAIILGAFVGLGLLAPMLIGYRLLAADRVDLGLTVVMTGVFVGMLLALGLLFGYRALSPEGVLWFGPALVVGFVLGFGVLALYAARTMLKSDAKD